MATIISRDDADTQVIYAVGANYSSNDYIPDGNKGGISLNDVASGADAVVQTRCIVSGFKKTAGAAWAEGEFLYFDPAAKAFTHVVQADGLFRGKAYKAALLADVVGDVEIIEPMFDEVGLMTLVATPTNGNLLKTNASGQAIDAAIAATSVQVLTVPAAAHSLAGLTAAGALEDTTILTSSIAGAVTMGGIFNDQMRNSTNTAQSTADATATIIDLEDVELVGDVTYAAGTTSLATIPAGASGIYAVMYELTFAAGAGTYNAAEIHKNGAYYTDTTETPDNANPIFVSDYVIMYLAAGDTIGLWGKQDSGGAIDVTSGRLAIQRIQ